MIFEQEIQIWPKVLVKKVTMKCTKMKTHTNACYPCKMIRKKKSFKVIKAPYLNFSNVFVDDGIGTTSMPRSNLEKFISFVCNFDPALQSEYQISSSCLFFLDIKFKFLTTISPHRFSTRKPTHTATFKMILLTTQMHHINPIF